MEPAPLDPRFPHESRLNPLDRPERRWRIHAIRAMADPMQRGGPGDGPQ